jgi:DNA-binding XRE family transcriptional regulator
MEGGDCMKDKINRHKPYNKLKGVLREKGITYLKLSQFLGISETSISHKVNGTSDFFLSEVNAMQVEYGFDTSIFLS